MKNIFLLIFTSLLIFTGCGGEGTCCGQNLVQTKNVTGNQVDKINKTPIAIINDLPINATDCSTVKVGNNLSHDLDGSIEEYIWSVDGIVVSNEKNPDYLLPCTDAKTEYEVCLTVIDDKQASSNKTCQIVKIIDKQEPVKPLHVIPTIEIPTPFKDGNSHVFDICEQSFDGHTVASYFWQITKHFKNGTTATHTNSTCQKKIYASVKEFESVDVTLTISYADGHSSTTTSSYMQSDDAQILSGD